MKRPIEEPKLKERSGHGTAYTHPAFGQISASRVSGGHGVLYGSDFVHHSSVAIRIKRSQLNRDLSRDWYYANEELIEVHLSEAQWATFVTAMNMGEGVPCTIDHVNREMMPAIPHRTQDSEFKNEVRAKIESSIETLQSLRQRIAENTSGLSKARAAELLNPIDGVLRQLESNLPFVADSFDKHVETTIEKAKMELHGYMNATLQRAGLEALVKKSHEPVLVEDTSLRREGADLKLADELRQDPPDSGSHE